MLYKQKYLKYKNKYINLKNMIGNGKQTEINQELEILKKKSKDYGPCSRSTCDASKCCRTVK